MSKLYEDPNWSQKNLQESLMDAQKHVKKNKFLASFATERLKYYAKELKQRHEEGHSVSFTDLWGLIIEAMLRDEVLHCSLTFKIQLFQLTINSNQRNDPAKDFQVSLVPMKQAEPF